MFATNNRVKRRPSPYEMEITDGESTGLFLCTHPSCWLEPPEGLIIRDYSIGVSHRSLVPWNPSVPESLPCS